MVTVLAAADVSAYAVPPFTSYVVDKAGALSPQQNARLEEKLARYRDQYGPQMALLVVPTLDGDTPENYAVQVFNTWQLGQKGKDDGLLMLVVMDQRKVKIEVGDGLEGDVTDIVSGRIIRNVMAPSFRDGDYAGGIDQAFDALMSAATGNAAPREQAHERHARRTSSPAMIFFFILFVIISSLGRRRRYGGWMLWGVGNALLNNRSSGGGFFGGGGGGGGFGGGGGGRSSGGGASGGW